MDEQMETVNVNLGERSYPVLIGKGILSELGPQLDKHSLAPNLMVVTTDDVWAPYGKEVEESLISSGFTPYIKKVDPPGEHNKSQERLGELYDFFLEKRLERRSAVIAVGGGVIGDLAGFLAATVLRGVPFVQVPTTLLAQVDSSVGGKVGINHDLGKNLIGAFYQPILVLADIKTLDTLPDDELRAGLAEVVKYGVIADEDFFQFLEQNVEAILKQDESAISRIIKRSCEIKAQVVADDEREGGLRAILNYGHTVGHAIEALSNFKCRHGEAVAWGMVYAALLSQEMGLGDSVARQSELLHRFGLLQKMPEIEPKTAINAMFHDKKVKNRALRFVLTEKIGSAKISDKVSTDIVEKVLNINPLAI